VSRCEWVISRHITAEVPIVVVVKEYMQTLGVPLPPLPPEGIECPAEVNLAQYGNFIRCSILLTFLVERPLDSEHLVITDYPEPFI
jgi:hypothetical protein